MKHHTLFPSLFVCVALCAAGTAAELAVGGSTALPTGLDPVAHSWVEVRPLASPLPAGLSLTLDAGEAAVIALAVELEIALVLIDERRGRQIARALGLTVAGSLGVLLRAKREGHLGAVKPSLEAMRRAGIRVADYLAGEVLRAADEE